MRKNSSFHWTVPSRVMVRKAAIMATAAFSVFLSGCFFFPADEKPMVAPAVTQPPVQYATTKVTRDTLANTIRGTLYVTAKNGAQVMFGDATGTVANIYFRPGDTVKAGDVLFDVEGLGTVSAEDIERQRINLEIARLQFKQYKSQVRDANLVKIQELQLSMQEIDYDKALEALKKQQAIAPIDGTLETLSPDIGDFVTAHQIVAHISDPSELILYCNATVLGLEMNTVLNVNIGKSIYNAKVTAMPLEVYESTDINGLPMRAYLLESINIPQDAITMGSWYVFNAELQRKEDVLVLPERAIRFNNSIAIASIMKDGVRQDVVVETGLRIGGKCEIISGLSEGDEVLLR